MRYSIVTPTIVRRTLLRTCESVDRQTTGDWEHLVIVDRLTLTHEQEHILATVAAPQRRIVWCPVEHRDFGHGCRHHWTRHALGDYIFHLDDDDLFAYDGALASLDSVTGKWAIFPSVDREGNIFYNDPPGSCLTNVSNYIALRELAQDFPAGGYGSDSEFVETLKKHPWEALPTLRPVARIMGFNAGREEVE